MNGGDVLVWLEDELAEAREEFACQLDRTNALVEMRSLALTIADREGVVAITAEALGDAVVDEEERALLVALVNRISPKEEQ